LVTAVALALVNLGLAALIVAAIGVASFVPWWIGGCAVALGVVAAVGAWRLWRQYLAASRDF
jgi:membrane protein implicated in regulation of membrane protease activity